MKLFEEYVNNIEYKDETEFNENNYMVFKTNKRNKPFYISKNIFDHEPEYTNLTLRDIVKLEKDKRYYEGKTKTSDCMWSYNKYNNMYCQFTNMVACIEKKRVRLNGSKDTGGYAIKNMGLIRMLQNGNPDENLTCNLSGLKLEGVAIKNNKTNEIKQVTGLWNLHHILVKNGKSVLKSEQDPSKFLQMRNLTNRMDFFIEMMGLTVLSNDSHKAVHSYQNSDLNFYTNDQLPYVLQSQYKYDKCRKFIKDVYDCNVSITYNEMIKMLTLKY